MPELQKRLVPYSSDDIQYMTQDVIIINNTRIPNHPKIFQSFSQFAYSKSELKKAVQTNTWSVNTMVLRKVMPKFDNTKYIGTRVKIASAEVINTEFGLALKVTSAPIPLQAGDSLPEGSALTASKILGFAKDRKTGEAYIGIDGKMDKWLIEKGVKEKDIAHLTPAMNEQIPALVGKVCICQRNSKGFLELA